MKCECGYDGPGLRNISINVKVPATDKGKLLLSRINGKILKDAGGSPSIVLSFRNIAKAAAELENFKGLYCPKCNTKYSVDDIVKSKKEVKKKDAPEGSPAPESEVLAPAEEKPAPEETTTEEAKTNEEA